MAGLLLLSSGGEFQKGNETADLYILGQVEGTVVIVAGTSQTARHGQIWFEGLGAKEVKTYWPEQPDEGAAHQSLETARLIYLAEAEPEAYRQNAALWKALEEARKAGATIAGAGGGAMVLGETFYDARLNQLATGRGILPGTAIVPHFNGSGRKWADKILALKTPPYLIGLDERVAIIGDGNDWQVWGRGWITLYRQGRPAKYQGGQPFKLAI